MLRGEIIGLRAQQDSDIEVFEAEFLNDAETRMRSDSRPWRPVAPGSADSPYRGQAPRGDHSEAVTFSAVELATGELVGNALLWGLGPRQTGRRASSLRATRTMTAASTTENPSSAVRALNAWVARPRPSTG